MGFYSCDSVTTSAFQVFETTYDGESPTATWLALRSSDFEDLLDDATSTFTSRTTSAGRSLTRASASNTESGTETASGRSTSGGAIFTTPPIPSVSEAKPSAPIGAIIGGVIGGLAVLGGLIGLLIFFLFKKKKKAAKNAGPPMAQNYENTAPPPPNGGGNGYFAPPGAVNGKYEHNDPHAAKYDGTTVQETPISPAPAYSTPPPPHAQRYSSNMPYSPAQSPPPEQDQRYSSYSQQGPPPPQGYAEAPGHSYAPVQPPQQPQTYYSPPPNQGSAAPAELGVNHATPTQYQGRPVYEAA